MFQEMEKNATDRHQLKMKAMKQGSMTLPQQIMMGGGTGSSSSAAGPSNPGSAPSAQLLTQLAPSEGPAAGLSNPTGQAPEDPRMQRPPSPSAATTRANDATDMVPLTDASGPPGAVAAATTGSPSSPPTVAPHQPDGNDSAAEPPAPTSPPGVSTARKMCDTCHQVVPWNCFGDDRDGALCSCPRCCICWELIRKDQDEVQVLDCMHVSRLVRSLL